MKVTAQLPKFAGNVFEPNDPAYEEKRQQYATSSHDVNGSMKPAAIIYVKTGDDIKKAIAYAKENNIAIAVRTGGHQYTGASSTFGPNVQLDMSDPKGEYGKPAEYDEPAGIVTLGVARTLGTLNNELCKFGVFVPHGQCSHVHVGGHAHTGGYGLAGRAFGLFSDHIIAVEVFTADGQDRWYSRNAPKGSPEADMFWAVLGGSPGNFGILTRIKLRVNKDKDHPSAHGLKMIRSYNREVLKELLKLKADMADDKSLPAGFDFCVSVTSFDPWHLALDLFHHKPGSIFNLSARTIDGSAEAPDEAIREKAARNLLTSYGVEDEDMEGFMDQLTEKTSSTGPSAMRVLSLVPDTWIVVFAQWSPNGPTWANPDTAKGTKPAQEIDPEAVKWFERIKAATGVPPVMGYKKQRDMSVLSKAWTLGIKREFNLPYKKRTWLTSSTQLSKDQSPTGWVETTVGQIDKMVQRYDEGLRVVAQIQHYGGDNSRYRTLADDKTSFSWRSDTTVVQDLDCFYIPKNNNEAEAEKWQEENDKAFIGANGCFFPGKDRRVLWGSYYKKGGVGSDMNTVWDCYYDSLGKFDKLREIKERVDPTGVFTPNLFSVRPSQGPFSFIWKTISSWAALLGGSSSSGGSLP